MMEYKDIITKQPISAENLVKFTIKNTEFVFDIKTLVDDYLSIKSYRKPYSNSELPENVINRIKQYIQDHNIQV